MRNKKQSDEMGLKQSGVIWCIGNWRDKSKEDNLMQMVEEKKQFENEN